MAGLNASTGSKLVVLGGILSIAVADALSDSIGMHISEETVSDEHHTVWSATLMTFLVKFVVGMSFAIPVIFLSLNTAMAVNIAWGVVLMTALSVAIARMKDENPLASVLEHVSIALVVVAITHFVGKLISSVFGSI